LRSAQRRRLPVPREELANERRGGRLRETLRSNDGGQERKQLNARARVVALFPRQGPRLVDLSHCRFARSTPREIHRVDSGPALLDRCAGSECGFARGRPPRYTRETNLPVAPRENPRELSTSVINSTNF